MNTPSDRRKENIEAIAAVSPLQQGMLFHALRSKEHDPYFYQLVFALRGKLDVAALERAWQWAVDRHQVLRADYRWEETATPLAVIYKQRKVTLERLDFSALDEAEHLERLRQLLGSERAAGYDFRNAAGVNVRLIALGPELHWLTWSYHHVTLDGWSMSLVLSDTFAFYQQLERGDTTAPRAALPFSSYLDWLSKQDQSQAVDYWKSLLGDFEAPTALPLDSAGGDVSYAEQAVELSSADSDRLKEAARRAGVTLNTLVQGAWALLLARHANESKVVFGSTVSGRALDLPDIEAAAGLFINTLPIQVPLRSALTVQQFLSELQQQNVNSRNYEHTPLVEIRRAAGVSGDAGLFDSVVVFDNYPVDEVLKSQPEALRVEPVRLFAEELAESGGRNNYSLTLNVIVGSRIKLTLAYRSDRFHSERIAGLKDALRGVLFRLADAPSERIGNIGLPSIATASSSAESNAAPLLLEAFAAHVARTPDALAVRCAEHEYSFAELAKVSDRIARRLLAQGVGTDDKVGLCAERSSAFVALLLGILKAGAAYVPLDPKLPAARLSELARESGARRVVASERGAESARAARLPVESLSEILAADDHARPRPAAVHPEQAAYVIFTSGSTGKPKGVVVSHGALARYVNGLLKSLELGAGTSMGMVSTIAADLGHTVLFGALAAGAPLHLIAEERAFDPDAFADVMSRHAIGVLKIVPSHLRALLHANDPAKVLPARALIVGGEATDWALVEQVQRLKPGCRIINHYGPTETTVGVSTFELRGARPDSATLPIGRALPGAELLVLDRDLNRLPSGTPGELYIGGARLARGYGGSPALTAERFVPDPASTIGGRLYRTGDRVRQSASGEIEFLGRMDRQVKIRGYRIELGEIEARLAAHPAVRQAVVLTRASTGGTLQLAAYVVGDGASSLPDTLQAYLAGIFPDYMLPSRIIALRELPLTPNGKLDRQALPWEERAAAPAAAPAGDITPGEQHLIDVWKEVLRVEHVGVDDNFFRLGGDSILSLQVIARARRRGLRITPKQLFDQQTVRELARVATRIEAKPPATAAPRSTSASAPKDVPLLPLQARFFEQRLPDQKRYTQSLLLTPRQPLVAAVLERALGAVVAQHEALALGFDEVEPGRWRARRGAANGNALWRRSAADERSLQPVLDEALGDFDLGADALLRVVLIDLASGGQRLFAVAHHLVVDGVSWRVLLEELESAYRQVASDRPVSLPERTASLAEWAERLHTHASSDVTLRELDFWSAQLGDVAPAPETPRSARWHNSELVLEREATRQLLSEAPEAYRTEINDLLLTALARALCRTSGQKSVTLMLEGHGREPLFDDVDASRTVGWLTSVFPVRLRPKLTGDGALGASIKAIKQQLRSVPRRGIGYGLLRYEGDAATRARLTALHEPGITFNYLGQLDQSFEPAGLFEPAGVGAPAGEHGVDPALSGSLAINAQVYGGALRVALAHDPALHDTSAIAALRDAYESELRALIEHTTGGASGATPSDFPLIGLDQAELDALPLVWHEIEDLYPLTPMQEGLLMHTLLEPGTGIYLMQHDHRIEDAVDVDAFRRAWQHVAEEYDVLRTAYVWNEGGMLQAVHKSAVTDLQFHDLRDESEAEREAALNAMLEDELVQGFDLARLPLWRVRLLRMGERSFRFVYSNHHILMDAWSRAQLLQDVFAVYQALVRGEAPPRERRAPFRDFIAWLDGNQAERAAEYFARELAGFGQATPLPSDRPLGKRGGVSAVGDVALFLTADESATINELASSEQLTVNTLVQAAWAMTLARYSARRDVLFGVTVAGRPVELPEMEKAVGLFINSIPLRVRLPRGETKVGDWLRSLLAQNAELRQHEHLPLVTIQAGAEVPRGQALFHSLFVFENAPVDVELIASAEKMSASAIGGRTHTNYPLTVVIYPGSRIGLHLSYDRRFFEQPTAQAVLLEFERLLHELVRNFGAPLASLALVPPAQRTALLETWNATEQAYPFERGYVPLFEERVRRQPHAIAAAHLSERITFAELNDQANRIAHTLARHDVPLDTPVALLAERGLSLLAGLVGTFKAGAAYLPLDPKHPPRRIADVLAQARPRALLTVPSFRGLLDEALAYLPAGERPELVFLEGDEVRSAPSQNPKHQGSARSLAYVIFTSGSTGKPKGAMVEHEGMLNNQLSKLPWFGLTEHDVIAQTASQCFDISVWQLLTGLLCGARTEIIPDAVAHDPAALLAHVRQTHVSVLESVPSLIQAFLEQDERELPSLRWLIATGEALPPALSRRWLERHPAIPIANAYGPAECSDDVSLARIDAPLGDVAFAPVGTPTDNNRLYVLDDELALVPAGVIAELCVAGTGVGRGYLGDPRRTAELFVPNPYAKTPGERTYRTGDLGRHRADGVLECVGRKDHQVKVRGYRIELGEIEARLRDHAAVSEAVVTLHESQSAKRLVGYVVAKESDEARDRTALVSELNRQLRASLPDYMLPAQLIVLDELPLSPNGKVDRKALPAPAWGDREQYVAPQSELGKSLAEIWRRVLGVPRVSLSDNFFELGGDSLSATQVVSRIRQDLKLSVPLRLMFETQSLDELERGVKTEGRRLEASHGWGSAPR